MPRKKKVEVAPEVEVNTTETTIGPESFKIEEVPKMKVTDFMEFVKGATKDETKKFIKDNHLIWRWYIPYNELVTVAQDIVRDTCYNVITDEETGEITSAKWVGVDRLFIDIRIGVHSFTLYIDLDYQDISFVEFYDFLCEYNLNDILRDLIAENAGAEHTYYLASYTPLEDVVDKILYDTQTNRQMESYETMKRIADSMESIQDSFRDAANAIASIIDAFNEGVTGAATSPDVIDAISSEIVNRMKTTE